MGEADLSRPTVATGRVPRRAFLAGSGASLCGLVVAGCGGDGDGPTPTPTPSPTAASAATIDFAQGDVAILNFAYALEQLEAAFYSRVAEEPPSGLDAAARRTLSDIGAHEVVHREFFKALLGRDALPALQPDFARVDFASAANVLETARTFEDLGVAAYNGAAQFFTGTGPLGLVPLQAAGEIVSVEARHASAIRTMIGGDRAGDFAPQAFDDALLPADALEAASPFLATKVELRNAPGPR